MDAEEVLQRIKALRAADKSFRVFGASGHKYKLAPPLTEKQVAAAEKQWGCELPDDYRTFLLEVGAGGAGPAYGIFPLIQEKRRWIWEGDGARLTSDLQKNFPHRKAWKASFKKRRASEDEDAWAAAHDAINWTPKNTVGAICLCHEGCALRHWLVVRGPERGNMWFDGRVDDKGLAPLLKKGKRLTFAAYYMDWLASAERSARAKK